MIVEKKRPVFRDTRGEIIDILQRVKVDSVTIISSRKGAVRGNHYHKRTIQYAYVLKGKFRLFTQEEGKRIQRKLVKEGDFITTPPLERHAFVAEEDSLLLTCFLGPRRGEDFEEDTYRLDHPISEPTRRKKR